jgi:1-acyl-sn-glycerol-3-phosphate acyltransferase
MATIRYFIVFPIMAITALFGIILMYIFRAHNNILRRYWSKFMLAIMGTRLEIIGKPNIKADLLIINHQSLIDIMVLESIWERDIAWIAKKEIADLPLFGHILKAPNMIIVDRENKKGLIKLIKDSQDRVEHGRPLAIFPEGTRGKGKKLKKFKSGAKIIAQKLNLKIQPIILTNTRRVMDSKAFKVNKESVKIVYLDPIEVNSEYDWFGIVEEKMNLAFREHKSLRDY